jgi:hypothetical protein
MCILSFVETDAQVAAAAAPAAEEAPKAEN